MNGCCGLFHTPFLSHRSSLMMEISTKRLILSHFKIEFAEEFTQALSHPEIFEFLPEDVPTLDDIKNIISWFIDRDLRNKKEGFIGTNLAIRKKAGNTIIGWCGIQPFEPMPEKKEIFYGLSPDYWHRGYMTEAANAVLKYGFENLNLNEIVAGVKPENRASISVLERIGFNFQSIIHSVPEGSEFYLNERFYSMTREQFLTQHV